MTEQQLTKRAKKLVSHVVDTRGAIEPKMVRAVAKAVAGSKWPYKAALLRQFSKEVLRIEASQTAVVESADKLSEADRAMVEQLLKKKHPTVRQIDWQTDSALLAGITVKAGDTWYNLSVQERLAQVQENLG